MLYGGIGRGPVAALMQATNGNFYGTTERGGIKVDVSNYSQRDTLELV
jgi:hypothetical protein